MRELIRQWLGHRVSGEVFDARLGQVLCFVAGVLILALSLWKLARLELTEAQLFLGVLLSLVVPLLFIVIGLLLPIASAIRRLKD